MSFLAPTRALFELRILLIIRRGRRRLRGFFLTLLIATAIGLWMGEGLFHFIQLSTPHTRAVTTDVFFLAVYVVWISAPLLGYPFSDFHDTSLLLPYPLSPCRTFATTTAATLVSPRTLAGIGVVTGLLAGLGGSLGFCGIRVLVILLFAYHCSVLAQSIHLALLAVFPRRILRDLAMVAAPLFSIGLYFSFRITLRHLDPLSSGPPVDLRSGPLALLPPLWIGQLVHDPIGAGPFAWLLGGGLLTLGTGALLLLGGRLLEASLLGERHRPRRGTQTGKEQEPGGRRPERTLWIAGFLPIALRAIAATEFRILTRHPAVQSLLVRKLIFVFLFLLLPFFEESAIGRLGSEFLIAIGFFLLFSETLFLTNIFGTDGRALGEYFSRGTSRIHFFLGKNLCHLLLFGTANSLVLVLFIGLTDQFHQIGAVLWLGILPLLPAAAAGNLVSLYLPYPLIGSGGRPMEERSRRPEGCLHILLSLGASLFVAITCTPTFALGLGILRFPPGPIKIASGIGAALYSVAAYLLLLGAATHLLTEREEAILARMQ